jgi:hypothetical protein
MTRLDIFLYRDNVFSYWKSDVDGKDIFECPDHFRRVHQCRVCSAVEENRALYRRLSSYQ